MKYRLPERKYSELVEVVENLYQRAIQERGLSVGQSFMYVEDETDLLRDNHLSVNNVKIYVALFKSGFEKGLVVKAGDLDFDYVIENFQRELTNFDLNEVSGVDVELLFDHIQYVVKELNINENQIKGSEVLKK